MQELSWTKAMEVGDPILDALRSQFVVCVNRIIRKLGDDTERENLNKILEEIDDLIFSIRSIQLDIHAKTQSTLLKYVLQRNEDSLNHFSLEAYRDKTKDTESVKLMLVEYLTRWYYEHIAGRDLVLRKYLVGFDIGDKVPSSFTQYLKRFAQSFSLKRGLPVIVLLLVSPSLVIAPIMINEEFNRLSTYQKVADISELYMSVSQVVHELQKERGMSSGNIASDGNIFENELLKQRVLTDSALKVTLEMLLISEKNDEFTQIQAHIKEVRSTIDVLDILRYLVDNRLTEHFESTDAYTRFIARIISISDDLEKLDTNHSIRRTISSLNIINHMKEAAGLERATGAAGFGSRKFDEAILQRLSYLIASQDLMYTRFETQATEDQKRLFENLIDNEAENELSKFRALAFRQKPVGRSEQTSSKWWEYTTRRINQLSMISQQLLSNLLAQARQELRLAQQQLVLMLVVGFMFAMLVWLATFIILRNFRRPIIQVADAMSELAKGNHEIIVSGQNRPNEIGELIRAYETFRVRLLRANLAGKLFTETKVTNRIHERKLKKEIELGKNYKKEAMEDFLTGLANRRALLNYAGKLLKKYKGRKGEITLIMFDIDNFKSINDTFGHAVGDEVIRSVAEACQFGLREDDLLARIGGEEFAVLLPNTLCDEAQVIAERMRKSIANLTVIDNKSSTITFTASFGISLICNEVYSVDQLLSNADAALYAAKKKGKNNVQVYSSEG